MFSRTHILPDFHVSFRLRLTPERTENIFAAQPVTGSERQAGSFSPRHARGNAVIYLAAANFFTLSLLAACVLGHLAVRDSWREIMAALRGELGREIRPSVQARATAPAPASAARRRAAA